MSEQRSDDRRQMTEDRDQKVKSLEAGKLGSWEAGRQAVSSRFLSGSVSGVNSATGPKSGQFDQWKKLMNVESA